MNQNHLSTNPVKNFTKNRIYLNQQGTLGEKNNRKTRILKRNRQYKRLKYDKNRLILQLLHSQILHWLYYDYY